MPNENYPPSRTRGLRRGGPGRPAGAGIAKEIRRRNGEDASALVDRLTAALDDEDTPANVKLAIIVFLRDTGWGKPRTREALEDAVERELARRFGPKAERLADLIMKLVSVDLGFDEVVARGVAHAVVDLVRGPLH